VSERPPPPRVFVSYSDDSAAHARRVLELAQWMRSHGVDAQIDQFEQSPDEGWPAWVYRQIRESEFVLVIATPEYLRRCEGDEPRRSPSDSAVKFGSHLTLQELHEAGGRNRKFVPVLFDGDAVVESVPLPLRGATCYRLPDQRDDLYRRLTGQPKVQRAPLGVLKTFDDESLYDSVDEFPEPAGTRARAELDEQRADDTLRVMLDAGVLDDPDDDPPPRRRLSKQTRQWLISITTFAAAFMAVGLMLGRGAKKPGDPSCQIQLLQGDGTVVDDIDHVVLELPSGEEIEIVVEDGRTLKFACRSNKVQAQAHVFLREPRAVEAREDGAEVAVERLHGRVELPAVNELTEFFNDEPKQMPLVEIAPARPIQPVPEPDQPEPSAPGPIDVKPDVNPVKPIMPVKPVMGTAKITTKSKDRQLNSTFASHKAELQRCYERGLASNPTLRGRIVADVEITSTGKLRNFEVVDDELSSSTRNVATCVGNEVERWTISKWSGSATTTERITIDFSPPG
jgi:hypothetical protein